MSETRPISSIKVGDRVRRDLGDLGDLMRSIEGNGALLQPIVIRPDGTLIAGARRLEACRRLGRSQIEVHVRADLASAVELLVAERDENVCRLDMAPSEKVALGRKLEELERPKARANQAAAGPHVGRGAKQTAFGESPKADRSPVRVREQVAEAIGMGDQSYYRAKKVVEAAETGDPIAQTALVEMDRTGKVEPAYRRVTERSVNGHNGHNGNEDAPALIGRELQLAEAAKKRTETVVGQCQAFPRGLPDIRVEQALLIATPREIAGWSAALTQGIRALTAFRKRLQGA